MKIKNIFKSKHRKLCDKWFKLRGDERFRLGHDLNKNSIVFDMGTYKGDFAENIFSKFGCRVYAFEPVKEFYQIAKERFSKNKKIKVYNFGLWKENREALIYLNEDGSSMHGKGEPEKVQFKEIIDFLKREKIKEIDLMEVNIEGGEYELLDYFIKTGLIKKIKNIQIQFHKNIKNYKEKRKEIQRQLNKTHFQIYCFPFIMENWKKRDQISNSESLTF